ncbi:rod shape-determining protein MreD [Enterococcus sp. 7F3_DIV0205]|uniref:Rod shape-determining protein MreD n=1 Tax=Candidatus Enterococcus palustris TaxID=1834189 RepID=A0AAQ3WA98_9ENTE|nr:rod shape-determining protein MreD [Enterococcus sp. 7F3_DIV0205]OTN83084.1 rod shape-determining protein MreD [Enterococcus sp. 7F3_DIV0205]
MIRKENVKYYAPVVFFLLMLIDGQLTQAARNITDNIYFANAHFLLLAFLMAVPNLSKRYLLITALVLGMVSDSYYIGIIGIYTVALVATVMMMYRFQRVVHTNLITAFFGMIIFVTTYELIAMGLQIIFHISNVAPLLFITKVLGPTLLFNMLIFVIFSYPLKRLFANE